MGGPMMTDQMTFMAGTTIDSAAQQLIAEAKKAGRTVSGQFNDIVIAGAPDSEPSQIVAIYHTTCEERAKAYRNSPEGKAAAERSERERAAMQAKHDALVASLPDLDWNNDVAVLDWMCEMQAPSDRSGVVIDRRAIVGAFEGHGFAAGVNCGPDFRLGDRDNEFRYLIGQAMEGIKNGPAIHGILHDFADQWRQRYVPSPSSGESTSQRKT